MKDPSVLVIDDDPKICRLLQLNLQADGYEVFIATSGREGLDMLFSHQPDVLILDLILVDIDGLVLCERVREFSDIPIIILSSRKSDDIMADGLYSGADDYIVKPFAQKVLNARLNAVLRRAKFAQSSSDSPDIVCGDILLDCRGRTVTRGDETVRLSQTEFRLLYLLMDNVNQVMTTDELAVRVWGFDIIDTQSLRTYIRYLRLKLEDDPRAPQRIITERGIGYRFVKTS